MLVTVEPTTRVGEESGENPRNTGTATTREDGKLDHRGQEQSLVLDARASEPMACDNGWDSLIRCGTSWAHCMRQDCTTIQPESQRASADISDLRNNYAVGSSKKQR